MIKFLSYRKEEDSEEELLPIRVSYFALKMLKNELNRSLSLTDDGTDYDAYETLLYWALRRGYQKVGKEMPFTREDMEEVMDEVYFQFMALIPEFFSDEEVKPKEEVALPQGKVEEPKKLTRSSKL